MARELDLGTQIVAFARVHLKLHPRGFGFAFSGSILLAALVAGGGAAGAG
jgi:hypothetical protein